MAESKYLVHFEVANRDIRRIWSHVRDEPFEVRDRFHSALTQLRDELSRNPLEWGEALYNEGKIIVSLGFSYRYQVEFGVHRELKLVLVKSFADALD